jgi:glycine cleavage system aminomethyltransferase T
MLQSLRLTRRNVSTVTTKIQQRRDRYLRSTFPEYSPNDPAAVSRGRRLGGLYQDPSRPVPKLDGSERFDEVDLESLLTPSEPLIPQTHVSEKRRQKVKQLLKATDHAVQSNRVIPKRIPHSPRVTRSPDGLLFPLMLPDTTSPTDQSLLPPPPSCSPIQWPSSTRFVELHGLTTASVVSTSLEEYRLARSTSILFDTSFNQIMDFYGQDVELTLDHFVAAPLRLLHVGGCVFSPLVDTKGYVLTTATVVKLGPTKFRVITPGNNRESVFRYISQFVVYSRQTGLDVHVTESRPSGIVELRGPETVARLIEWFRRSEINRVYLGSSEFGPLIPKLDFLTSQPHLSAVEFIDDGGGSISLIRHDDNKFTMTLSDSSNLESLTSTFPLGGVYTLDMLRMEQGIPRAGVDIPVGKHSPVRAGLEQWIDMKKVREKILFGHVRIAKELLGGTTGFKRIQLVSSKYVYGGCRILSAPQRFPIGEITSCAWIPELKARVCHAQIKAEYAVPGTQVLVNIPNLIPEKINPKFKKRIVKQGNLQSVFRNLVVAHLRV